MEHRLCPECDARTAEPTCPACGVKTLLLPEADAPDPMLGRLVDERYRIQSLLGRGGMGAVYRALHVSMNKVVAVKVVRPELGGTVDAAKRFHREARAASLLSHPHTIRVFDFGQMPDRTLYMVMEYLDGRSLARVVATEGPLPVERAVRIASEVAQSLVEAHERGLVHRDLKPENILLIDTAGHPDFAKVLDFGIAKILTGSSGVSSVTDSGAVIGTPYYMAPEQASAPQGITAAVDVYALGVILYEMLTGRLPFTGDTPMEVLMAHVTRPAPDLPAELGVPAGLRTLLARMLSKDPAVRPTAAGLLDEFAGVRGQAPEARPMAERARELAATPATPGPSADSLVLLPRRAWWPWVVAGALALAGSGVVAWWVASRAPSAPPPRVTEPRPTPVQQLPAPAPAPAPVAQPAAPIARPPAPDLQRPAPIAPAPAAASVEAAPARTAAPPLAAPPAADPKRRDQPARKKEPARPEMLDL